MERKLSSARVRLLFGAAVCLTTLTTGCTTSLRYPADTEYRLRTDLLVGLSGKEIKLGDAYRLPPPGALDEHIVHLAREYSDTYPTADPMKIDGQDREELRKSLRAIFGTPRQPKVDAAGGEDLALDVDSLRSGSALYRRHCMHCHGVTGDGRGPTGPWVHPHPRDYRSGKFKFISIDLSLRFPKPRRIDLFRTISRGIDGTSMPSFGLLPEQELQDLVSYVIHLSLRGQVEFETMETLLDAAKRKADLEGPGIEKYVQARTKFWLGKWDDANKKDSNRPQAYPIKDGDTEAMHDSIRKGHALFIGKGICITCHLDYGRQSLYKYDEWGTLVRPRNLTEGVYRGGRRPLDIYWRITGGIKPSGMSALPDEVRDQAWHLVNFVRALPYPSMLPSDIRDKVYGSTRSLDNTRVSR